MRPAGRIAVWSVGIAIVFAGSVMMGLPKVRHAVADEFVNTINERKLAEVTTKLPDTIDGGQLYVLSRKIAAFKQAGKTFTVYGEDGKSMEVKIEKTISLDRDNANELSKAWRKLEFRDQRASMFHIPKYGIVFTAGEKEIVATSVDVEYGSFWYFAGFGEFKVAVFDINDGAGQEFIRLLKMKGDTNPSVETP